VERVGKILHRVSTAGLHTLPTWAAGAESAAMLTDEQKTIRLLSTALEVAVAWIDRLRYNDKPLEGKEVLQLRADVACAVEAIGRAKETPGSCAGVPPC
jgi:hypothetical protein